MKVMKSVAGEKPTKLLVAKPKGQAKAKIPAKSKRWQKLKPQTPEAKPAEVRRRPASSEAKPAAARRRPASSQAKGSGGDTSLRAHLAPFFGMKTIYNNNDDKENLITHFIRHCCKRLTPAEEKVLRRNMKKGVSMGSACTGSGQAECVHIVLHRILGLDSKVDFPASLSGASGASTRPQSPPKPTCMDVPSKISHTCISNAASARPITVSARCQSTRTIRRPAFLAGIVFFSCNQTNNIRATTKYINQHSVIPHEQHVRKTKIRICRGIR